MVIVLSGVVGAVLALVATLAFNLWKFHRDERAQRIDEFCSLVSRIADDAAEYWSSSYTDATAQRVKEAKIFSTQALIDGIADDLRSVLDTGDGQAVSVSLADLYDGVSGGDFSVFPRPVDPTRIRKAGAAAAATVLAVRRAHRQTIPLNALVRAYHANRLRKLDMPKAWQE